MTTLFRKQHVAWPRSVLRYTTAPPSHQAICHDLRSLMRKTAQPVAVVTSRVHSANDGSTYHGATLSSFASVAMDPYPLITFALRIPSRMAASLKSTDPLSSHMVINLLSASQASTAVKFSRPDLCPDPFSTTPYSLTSEGMPALEGSLGAISCKLVSVLPLYGQEFFNSCGSGAQAGALDVDVTGDAVVSELFIARVLRVETARSIEEGEESSRTLPLIYHHRQFTTCQAKPLIVPKLQ